jgi:hypothetical protein
MASHRRKQQSDQSVSGEGGEQAIAQERMVSHGDDDMR